MNRFARAILAMWLNENFNSVLDAMRNASKHCAVGTYRLVLYFKLALYARSMEMAKRDANFKTAVLARFR